MELQEIIALKKNEFIEISQKHNVKYLYAFGSSITDSFNPGTSDIDLLVDIDDSDPIERGEKLISLWNLLEKFFRRKVDLLTDASIHNPFLRKSIDASKVLIYDGTKQKVLI